MERNLNPLDFVIDYQTLPEIHENSRCDTCGEEFEQPLFAVVYSDSFIEGYYACPRCLSRMGDVERPKNVEAEDAEEDDPSQEAKVEIEVDKMEETVACVHHLGYLKRRPKNTPIPEECLTCTKMIECMSY